MKLLGVLFMGLLGMMSKALGTNLKVGDPAPLFKSKTHENKDFDLASRKGSWTVLFFYPKADTPGCTKQACAFRDSVEKIRKVDGEVFGISGDDVEALVKFKENHQLNFPLLADPNAEVIKLYDVKMPLLKMASRTTFIIDPSLKIQYIDPKVDPVKDADNVVRKILELKSK